MDKGFKNTVLEDSFNNMSTSKIKISSLYKIFGKNPEECMRLVKNGMGKDELLEKHQHVLGLQDINIDVEEKNIQVVMGLSGSGKSTLIRHINRLIEPTSGSVEIDGKDVMRFNREELRDYRRNKTAMVFQRFALLPHKTVLQNVAFGLFIQNIDELESRERSMKWIEKVGLLGYEEKYPQHLSGGMQQRVGLARALATDAEILLMDEAFSALDPLIRTDMQDVLLSLQEELNKTILFITHDLDEALRIGDDIAILRDGQIVQKGSPQEIVLKPADGYVFDFIKDINRSRVLKVKSIMNYQKADSGPSIEESIVLEDAIQILNQSGEKTAIVTQEKKIIGSVDLEQMIAAIARPSNEHSTSIPYR